MDGLLSSTHRPLGSGVRSYKVLEEETNKSFDGGLQGRSPEDIYSSFHLPGNPGVWVTREDQVGSRQVEQHALKPLEEQINILGFLQSERLRLHRPAHLY